MHRGCVPEPRMGRGLRPLKEKFRTRYAVSSRVFVLHVVAFLALVRLINYNREKQIFRIQHSNPRASRSTHPLFPYGRYS